MIIRAVLDIYNSALNKRIERKNFMFANDCLEFKKVQTNEKKRTQDEKDVLKRVRVFSKLLTPDDHLTLVNGLHGIRLMNCVMLRRN